MPHQHSFGHNHALDRALINEAVILKEGEIGTEKSNWLFHQSRSVFDRSQSILEEQGVVLWQIEVPHVCDACLRKWLRNRKT